ncbi:MAG: zinc-ribbon domain-containing protein [Polyangiaceae bacterium]|nr:zinc-ribbon domain-containing protein [Polyangiaceae bacterium]
MKISCPACSAKYSIGDDKVRDRLAKIRCRKCGATIVIDGKVNPPHIHTADGDGGAGVEEGTSAESYSVDLGGGEPRTMTVAEIITAYNTGEVTAQTFVWAEGFADWKAISDVPELVGALHGATPAAAAAPPWAGSKSTAPARAAARAGGGDLFGGYAQAGSEEDVTTSAPDPAPATTAGVGARNESSVLFSLSALTASSPSHPAPAATRSATTATAHDSGLIDLRAMADQAPPPGAGAASPLGGSPLGGPLMTSSLMNSPLGMAAPLGGSSAQAAAIAIPDLPQRRSNVGMIIGVIGVLVGIVAIVVVVSQSTKEPPPVVPTQPSVVYIEKTVTAPRDDDDDAKAPATGDAKEEEADAGPPKPTARGTWRPRPRSTSGGTGTTSKDPTPAAATTTAKKASSGGCGCPPGDLQCAMRCAAK